MIQNSIAEPWESMYKGYRRLFWGIIVTILHINLGPIQILPSFIGYIIISSGLESFKNVSDSPKLKRAFIVNIIILIYSMIELIFDLSGKSIVSLQRVNVIIIGVFACLMLIMIYEIFSYSSDILRSFNKNYMAIKVDRKLKVFVVLHTIISFSVIVVNIYTDEMFVLIAFLSKFLLFLWLAFTFSSIKKEYETINDFIENTEIP